MRGVEGWNAPGVHVMIDTGNHDRVSFLDQRLEPRIVADEDREGWNRNETQGRAGKSQRESLFSHIALLHPITKHRDPLVLRSR